MKKTKQQQQYKYEEFSKHISLWNCIPAGQGNSLVLLRKIVNGIQSGSFTRNPSIVIVGENSRELGIATANTLCSPDIREIESKYFNITKNIMDFFSDSTFETVHIITNNGTIGINESVLWSFLKKREYKFSRIDGSWEIIYPHGTIIICAEEIKLVPPSLVRVVDFKVNIESYTQDQLELIVHQRLRFCGIDYNDDEEVLKNIIEYSQGEVWRIIDLIKICILLVQNEGRKLTVKTVKQASKLI